MNVAAWCDSTTPCEERKILRNFSKGPVEPPTRDKDKVGACGRLRKIGVPKSCHANPPNFLGEGEQ